MKWIAITIGIIIIVPCATLIFIVMQLLEYLIYKPAQYVAWLIINFFVFLLALISGRRNEFQLKPLPYEREWAHAEATRRSMDGFSSNYLNVVKDLIALKK